ncbi:MAG TPA: hypothetical protein DEZ08_03080 [Dehalococcoidia bacterium]|jgi:hypothetical protein|nr:hypothetical protein [Dehalococcoidia bacterium]
MSFYRIYTGEDQQSHIEELDLKFAPFTDIEGAFGVGTDLIASKGITFRVAEAGYELEWHCAPRKQFTISLSGTAEIELGDGTKQIVNPGDVLLAEDLTGQGHITRVTSSEPRVHAVVHL